MCLNYAAHKNKRNTNKSEHLPVLINKFIFNSICYLQLKPIDFPFKIHLNQVPAKTVYRSTLQDYDA